MLRLGHQGVGDQASRVIVVDIHGVSSRSVPTTVAEAECPVLIGEFAARAALLAMIDVTLRSAGITRCVPAVVEEHE